MRLIRTNSNFAINFGFAGGDGEALLKVEIKTPIDGNKYFNASASLIDCIDSRALPVLDVDAINQEFTAAEIANIRGFGETGIYHSVAFTDSNQIYLIDYLVNTDNAVDGVAGFPDGAFKPTYT